MRDGSRIPDCHPHDRRRGDFGAFLIGMILIMLVQTLCIYLMTLSTKDDVLDIERSLIETRGLLNDEKMRDQAMVGQIIDTISILDESSREREERLESVLREAVRALKGGGEGSSESSSKAGCDASPGAYWRG